MLGPADCSGGDTAPLALPRGATMLVLESRETFDEPVFRRDRSPGGEAGAWQATSIPSRAPVMSAPSSPYRHTARSAAALHTVCTVDLDLLEAGVRDNGRPPSSGMHVRWEARQADDHSEESSSVLPPATVQAEPDEPARDVRSTSPHPWWTPRKLDVTGQRYDTYTSVSRMTRAASCRQDVRPPRPPWRPLEAVEPPTAYLCFYYSDDLSPLPVRHVTRPGDCKSDPNLETRTFGLFSTCEPSVRSAMVNNGARYLFFLTRRGADRVVAGMYRVGWWCGPSRGPERDVRLAAEEVYFVPNPLPVGELPEPARAAASRPMRSCRPVDAMVTSQLLDALRRQEDASPAYLREIDRLERFNSYRTSARYPGWGQNEPFTWDLAHEFLRKVQAGAPAGQPAVRNQSDTQLWRCPACGEVRRNQSRLRRCPACKQVVTLEVVSPDQEV